MASETNPEEVAKRAEEEIRETASDGGGGSDGIWNKQKVGAPGKAVVGYMVSLDTQYFTTSREMFGILKGLLLNWAPNFPVFEAWARTLLDLVKKGHPEPEKLIGCGVQSFSVRYNMMCSDYLTYYIRRKDGSTADFCFRSCVNNILPLPEDVKDLGRGAIAVCACHVPGGYKSLEDANIAEQNERFRREWQARLDKEKQEEEAAGGADRVILGPFKFKESLRMYERFFWLLLRSPLDQALSEKYAHQTLLELLEKGDPEWLAKKIGSSKVIESFQVRIHPAYDSGLRSFYLVKGDGSIEDFCFIKCVDNIFPLPKEFIEKCVGPCSCHHEGVGKVGVALGWQRFWTSVEMGSYFDKLISMEPLNKPINNKVTHAAVLDLLKKGDSEWEKKIGSGGGLQSFQVRTHPELGRRFYFFVRKDGSMESFCFWTCIDNILPLPEEYKSRRSGVISRHGGTEAGGGGGSGRGTKRWRQGCGGGSGGGTKRGRGRGGRLR